MTMARHSAKEQLCPGRKSAYIKINQFLYKDSRMIFQIFFYESLLLRNIDMNLSKLVSVKSEENI